MAMTVQEMWEQVLADRAARSGPSYVGPAPRMLDGDDGTGLSGFQRGITSGDGAPPVPENVTPKAPPLPPVVAVPPPAAPPPRDFFSRGYAEQVAAQRPTTGAIVGRQAPVEMVEKKDYVGKDDNGNPIYHTYTAPKEAVPAFQVPSTQNLAEKTAEDKAAAAAKAPAAVDPKTLKFEKPAGGASGADASGASGGGINWGVGSGIGGGIIPAHEVAAVSKSRQGQLIGAVEGQKAAVGEAGEASADVERQKAIGSRDVAKAYEDAGVDARLRAQAAVDDAKAYRKHIDDFSARLSTDKIDPQGLWNSQSTGQKVAWTLAKALGAVGQAFLHTSTNQVADAIDQMAAQDVAAQRANHEIGRERLADMNTAYSRALQVTGDKEQAERVATGYALEAAKQNAQALAENATSAVQKAKGKEVVAALDEKIAEKGIVMNPLVQARAGAGGADLKQIAKDAKEYINHQATLGQTVSPDDAFRWSVKMNTGRDPTPAAGAFVGGAKGDGGGVMTREQRGKIAQDRQETQTASDEFNRQMDKLNEHPVITGTGLTDAAFAHLPQRVAPKSNDYQQQLEAINTQMLQAVGKVAKDADGKPNKAMIEKIEKNFGLHLGDTPDIKRQKLNGVRSTYNALAREQGATAPEPNAPVHPVDPTFKKE